MISYIAFIILIFALIQMLVALLNLLFKERLPVVYDNESLPSLSILIPVRNEEANIENLLNDLTSITDRFTEIIVYDDQSTDDTAKIVKDFALSDSRIRLIAGSELPVDWYGKSHACYQLSREATGDFFVFIDADVRIREGVIDRSLKYMDKYRCDLMSIFPTQVMKTLGEKIAVPNMQIILLTLLPLPLVRLSQFSSLSAANGQFMFFRALSYKELQPHKQFRKSRAEDIEISRYLKKHLKRVSCITGVNGLYCWMYHSISDAIEGFSKNVTYFFGNSLPTAVIYWLITTFGFILFLVLGRIEAFWIWLTATFINRIATSITARMKVLDNLLFMLPQQLVLGLFIIRYIINSVKKTFLWKGRTI